MLNPLIRGKVSFSGLEASALTSLETQFSWEPRRWISKPLAKVVAVFAAVLTVAALPAAGSPALVQHASKDAGTAISSSLAFPSSNVAGNWIGVVIRAGHSAQSFTISDTRGNSYRQAVLFNQTRDTPNGDTLGIFYAENIAGGANTVTVSTSISNNTLRFSILEYSGLATSSSLDMTATAAAQGSGTSANSGSGTTTAAGPYCSSISRPGLCNIWFSEGAKGECPMS
jgi:hypothetical protein